MITIIRLVYCSQAWPDGYDLEPIRVNGLWVPGLGHTVKKEVCIAHQIGCAKAVSQITPLQVC